EAGNDEERHRAAGQLLNKLFAKVFLGGAAGDKQAGAKRDDEGRHLGDDAVADGELGERLHAAEDVPTVLQLADGNATDDVNEDDDDAGDSIAADKFRSTVHGPVELGFASDIRAATFGFVFFNDAGVEVSIDRHLLAGHGVQSESGGDF